MRLESKTPQKVADKAKCPSDEEDMVATPAARQRLRRLCRRRANGTLTVPEEVHKKYAAGGSEREGLLKLLVKSGFNKDFYVVVHNYEPKKPIYMYTFRD